MKLAKNVKAIILFKANYTSSILHKVDNAITKNRFQNKHKNIFLIHPRPIHVTTELVVSLGGSFHPVTITGLEARKLHLQIMIIQVLLHIKISSTITLPKENRSTKV